MMTVDQFIAGYIGRWEGTLSVDPNDNGNWYLPGASAQKKGQGTLVGSKYGVTGATLAAYLGRTKVTAADMAAMTFATACAIAKKLFYTDAHLDRLAWNRVTASVLDFCWGAGPDAGIRLLQDMLDVAQDGLIGAGGLTATAFAKFVGTYGEEVAAGAWWSLREHYYESLVVRAPTDIKYLKGWDNRSAWFLPGQGEGWWSKAA